MRGSRLINIANDFYENYARSNRHNEYEDRYRIEKKLEDFAREEVKDALAEKLVGVLQIVRILLADVAEKPSRLDRAIQLANQQLEQEMQP